jgi:argininosuccinate lyase
MQEDKPPVFDAFDTVDTSLTILAGCLATARFDATRMRAALREGFTDATELADYLAARNVPFREAHHIAGRLVRLAQSERKGLAELSLEQLRTESSLFDVDVYAALDPETAVERRQVPGGPARAMVLAALAEVRSRLESRDVDPNALATAAGVEQP